MIASRSMAPLYTQFQKWLLSPPGLGFARRIAGAALATLHTPERIPQDGPVLIVSNHSFAGLDSPPLGALLALHTGRAPYFLAERNFWRVPGIRWLLAHAGGVAGTRDNAARLLARGELVIAYPGGVDDAFKLTKEAYTLKWGDRRGFAHVAVASKAPVVPIAATGIDETFELHCREHILGRLAGGSPRYDIPLPVRLLPRRARFDYHVLPPIKTSGLEGDPNPVERVRRTAYQAIDSVLAPYRARLQRLAATQARNG